MIFFSILNNFSVKGNDMKMKMYMPKNSDSMFDIAPRAIISSVKWGYNVFRNDIATTLRLVLPIPDASA